MDYNLSSHSLMEATPFEARFNERSPNYQRLFDYIEATPDTYLFKNTGYIADLNEEHDEAQGSVVNDRVRVTEFQSTAISNTSPQGLELLYAGSSYYRTNAEYEWRARGALLRKMLPALADGCIVDHAGNGSCASAAFYYTFAHNVNLSDINWAASDLVQFSKNLVEYYMYRRRATIIAVADNVVAASTGTALHLIVNVGSDVKGFPRVFYIDLDNPHVVVIYTSSNDRSASGLSECRFDVRNGEITLRGGFFEGMSVDDITLALEKSYVQIGTRGHASAYRFKDPAKRPPYMGFKLTATGDVFVTCLKGMKMPTHGVSYCPLHNDTSTESYMYIKNLVSTTFAKGDSLTSSGKTEYHETDGGLDVIYMYMLAYGDPTIIESQISKAVAHCIINHVKAVNVLPPSLISTVSRAAIVNNLCNSVLIYCSILEALLSIEQVELLDIRNILRSTKTPGALIKATSIVASYNSILDTFRTIATHVRHHFELLGLGRSSRGVLDLDAIELGFATVSAEVHALPDNVNVHSHIVSLAMKAIATCNIAAIKESIGKIDKWVQTNRCRSFYYAQLDAISRGLKRETYASILRVRHSAGVLNTLIRYYDPLSGLTNEQDGIVGEIQDYGHITLVGKFLQEFEVGDYRGISYNYEDVPRTWSSDEELPYTKMLIESKRIASSPAAIRANASVYHSDAMSSILASILDQRCQRKPAYSVEENILRYETENYAGNVPIACLLPWKCRYLDIPQFSAVDIFNLKNITDKITYRYDNIGHHVGVGANSLNATIDLKMIAHLPLSIHDIGDVFTRSIGNSANGPKIAKIDGGRISETEQANVGIYDIDMGEAFFNSGWFMIAVMHEAARMYYSNDGRLSDVWGIILARHEEATTVLGRLFRPALYPQIPARCVLKCKEFPGGINTTFNVSRLSLVHLTLAAAMEYSSVDETDGGPGRSSLFNIKQIMTVPLHAMAGRTVHLGGKHPGKHPGKSAPISNSRQPLSVDDDVENGSRELMAVPIFTLICLHLFIIMADAFMGKQPGTYLENSARCMAQIPNVGSLSLDALGNFPYIDFERACPRHVTDEDLFRQVQSHKGTLPGLGEMFPSLEALKSVRVAALSNGVGRTTPVDAVAVGYGGSDVDLNAWGGDAIVNKGEAGPLYLSNKALFAVGLGGATIGSIIGIVLA